MVPRRRESAVVRPAARPLQYAMRSASVVIHERAAGGRGLFAAAPLRRGEVLIDFSGYPILDRPTRISLQIDADRHIEGSEETNAFLNHSCAPTAYYDYSGVYLRALRDISTGEEVTVDYNAGDYDLFEKFECRCGASRCVGTVGGFRHLSPERRRELLPFLAPYPRAMVEKDGG